MSVPHDGDFCPVLADIIIAEHVFPPIGERPREIMVLDQKLFVAKAEERQRQTMHHVYCPVACVSSEHDAEYETDPHQRNVREFSARLEDDRDENHESHEGHHPGEVDQEYPGAPAIESCERSPGILDTFASS